MIRVIKLLIVMGEVKDLGEGGEDGGVGGENVKVGEEGGSIEEGVEGSVDRDKESCGEVERIYDVVKGMCSDGDSYVMSSVISNIDCEEGRGGNGNCYVNGFVSIGSGVKDGESMGDGRDGMGMVGGIEMGLNEIVVVMGKEKL